MVAATAGFAAGFASTTGDKTGLITLVTKAGDAVFSNATVAISDLIFCFLLAVFVVFAQVVSKDTPSTNVCIESIIKMFFWTIFNLIRVSEKVVRAAIFVCWRGAKFLAAELVRGLVFYVIVMKVLQNVQPELFK